MENKFYVLIGIALLLILGFQTFGIYKISGKLESKLGAISGPTITSPYLTINDVENTYFSSGFNTASSTLCSFKLLATSTLAFTSMQITTATNTALTIDFGKSTVPDATTTAIGSTAAVASSAKATVVASTTLGLTSNTFAPGDYINIKKGGGFGATDAHGIKGKCKATFIVN